MDDIKGILVEHWTVDYCDGSSLEEVSVPHCWKQDVCLNYEGPVVYRTSIEVPNRASKLVFMGVSYAADVALAGVGVLSHRGIWDAFEVPLDGHTGRNVEISVTVRKNGGATYPVQDVASGFLPYVFHTFGGIHGEVFIVDKEEPFTDVAPALNRATVSGSQIYVDGKPFYGRGLLHWGWYPELGHTNPPAEVIRSEVRSAKELGFNLVKFCLWIPPHRYLEILRDEGMEAWIELPLWKPTSDPAVQARIGAELEQIVRQYRRHENIILWTIGCELGGETSPEFRQRLTQLVKNLTGSELVKDSSGGAEMYGGNLNEFGDFYDFHPYCDTQFIPTILDSLMPGPRPDQPLFLGEFNDVDVHRDLPRLAREIPFWCSTLSELNEPGVRGQYDLPIILGNNRFAHEPAASNHSKLRESSRQKALFMRKSVLEAVRARDKVSGYVITGWRDTPISSSGFFDDWDDRKFTNDECCQWNSPTCLYALPNRRPPWVNGGNRPGYGDAFNQIVGQIYLGIGIHSEIPLRGGLIWQIKDVNSNLVAQGASERLSVQPLCSMLVGHVDWDCANSGKYLLEVEFANVKNSWTIWVSDPFSQEDKAFWLTDDPLQVLGFVSKSGRAVLSTRVSEKLRAGLLILTGEGSIPKPFWRESAYEFRGESFWADVPFAERWERFLPISPDRVLSHEWLVSLNVPYEVLMNRIDVRNYHEDPVLVRAGVTFITTLRPFGGLGIQPCGIPTNAAGADFLRAIKRVIER